MAHSISIHHLTTEERIELMGRLWDSLEPALAAPIPAALAAELDLRETEADASPDEGEAWSNLRDNLRKTIA